MQIKQSVVWSAEGFCRAGDLLCRKQVRVDSLRKRTLRWTPGPGLSNRSLFCSHDQGHSFPLSVVLMSPLSSISSYYISTSKHENSLLPRSDNMSVQDLDKCSCTSLLVMCSRKDLPDKTSLNIRMCKLEKNILKLLLNSGLNTQGHLERQSQLSLCTQLLRKKHNSVSNWLPCSFQVFCLMNGMFFNI